MVNITSIQPQLSSKDNKLITSLQLYISSEDEKIKREIEFKNKKNTKIKIIAALPKNKIKKLICIT